MLQVAPLGVGTSSLSLGRDVSPHHARVVYSPTGVREVVEWRSQRRSPGTPKEVRSTLANEGRGEARTIIPTYPSNSGQNSDTILPWRSVSRENRAREEREASSSPVLQRRDLPLLTAAETYENVSSEITLILGNKSKEEEKRVTWGFDYEQYKKASNRLFLSVNFEPKATKRFFDLFSPSNVSDRQNEMLLTSMFAHPKGLMIITKNLCGSSSSEARYISHMAVAKTISSLITSHREQIIEHLNQVGWYSCYS